MAYGQLTGAVCIPHGGYVNYFIKLDQTLGDYAATSFFPSAYPPPSGLSDLVHLTTSGNHVLYVQGDGSIGGWGSDSNSLVSGPSAQADPLFLHASWNRSYLIDQSGALTIWGSDFAGAATPPAPITDAVMAVGGNAHSVVLHSDGTITAFGDNNRGQTSVPVGLSDVVEIACGHEFSVALKSDGTVEAFGYNNRGQTDVPAGLSGVVQIQCGREHVVALKDDGTVECWGDNAQGQCNTPAFSSSVVQVSVTGDEHNLAVLDTGELVWWGYDGADNGEMVPPPGTLVYMPTSTPSGNISTSVEFSVQFLVDANINGSFTAYVPFSSELNGSVGNGAELTGLVDFSALLEGFSVSRFGNVSAKVNIGAQFNGFQDWTASINSLQLQEIYRLIITGAADGLPDLIVGRISSWQATNQAGDRSAYIQAVIPAADEYVEQIEARQNGELVIQKGYRFSDGSSRYEEILRSPFDTLRPDEGQRALTITVSGYFRGKPVSKGSRTLTGIRSISTPNGKRRVRCDIDFFLQPGMTVDALGKTFTADYINYYVNESGKFAEVGER